MTRLWIVVRHELSVTLRRRSFQYLAFGAPLVTLLLFGFLPMALQAVTSSSGDVNHTSKPTTSTTVQPSAEGYVDRSGLLRSLPSFVPPGRLVAFQDELAARQALQEGRIRGFYLIPADYLTSGKVVLVQAEFNPVTALGQSQLFQSVLQVILLSSDEALALRYNAPLHVEVTWRNPQAQPRQDNPWTFLLPYISTLLFYIVILMSSSLLLSSITKDKENRMLEVLVSSSSPDELLWGKILGLGTAGLLQSLVWLGSAYALLRLRSPGVEFLDKYPLPPSTLATGLIFFILGYALYSSLMASIGALVPNMREASQLSIVLVLPMLLPLMMITLLVRQPNGWIAILLSLFPLTAPVTMVARLLAAPLPAWQAPLSAALIVAATYLVLRLASRLFRAQYLLTGQTFSLGKLWHSVWGRVLLLR
jgi:ABC-2 type transport system permease protein